MSGSFNVRWKRSLSEGASCWKTQWATVWDNGVWHTWDKHGTGGENSREPTVINAMAEAMKAAHRQGFIALPGDKP